jgi:hypothetical protein
MEKIDIHTLVKRTLSPEVVVSPETYINYVSSSPKQQKRMIMQTTQHSTRKLTNQGATTRSRRGKFMSPPGSGELSC